MTPQDFIPGYEEAVPVPPIDPKSITIPMSVEDFKRTVGGLCVVCGGSIRTCGH